MAKAKRSKAFFWFIFALALVLALGVWLMVVGLTTPPYLNPIGAGI